MRTQGGQAPPASTWVAVEGWGMSTLSPELEGSAFAEIEAERVVPVEAPPAPYE